MTDTLIAMARRMGATVSDAADAQPWSADMVEGYAEKHGQRSDLLGHQHLPDIQIAGAVRMLMRNDLDHEAVVCAARDRICALHVEKAALAEALVKIRKCLDLIDPSRTFQYMQAMDAMRTCADAALKRAGAL